MKKIVITIATAAGMLMIASCAKEAANEAMVGTIRFGASTVYENGPATKTEYSGKDQNNNSISSSSTYERIDWLSTDKIRILCDQASLVSGSNHYADYSVSGISASSQKSTASITPADGNGLQWGTGTHYFYGYYPSAVQNSNATIVTKETNLATVTGVIPTTQTVTQGTGTEDHVFKPNMDNAYMYAYASASSGGNVTLSFKPLFTAVEFTLLTDSTNPITDNKLTKVTLSSTQSGSYLAGNFSATLNQSASFEDLNVTSGSNSIDINIPGGGVDLSTSTAYTVTFLMLPQGQTELTLTLTFADNSTKALKLKNDSDWVSIPACKKTYIWKLAAPKTVETYTYTISATAPSDFAQAGSTETYSVTSYKTGDTSGNKTAVSWTAEFSTDGGTTWSSDKPSWLTFTTSGDGSTSPRAYSAVASANNSYTGWAGTTTSLRDSKSNAYDLSCYDIYGNSTGGTERSTPYNTANCYVVSAPGWYCFPCVYGNAITGGSDNENAYKKGASDATNIMGAFKNHAGNGISYPWIKNNSVTIDGASILWQDVSDMIQNVSFESDYIYFYVNPSSIAQGNAVVTALAGSTVVWSWHIWVMDNPTVKLATKDVYSHASTNKSVVYPQKMMLMNLGTREGTSAAQGRSVMVRFSQTGSAEKAIITIKQNGSTAGYTSTHYQWGRKDPFSNSDSYVSKEESSTSTTPGLAIQNPSTIYYLSSSPYDWSTTRYDNLWNTNVTTYADSDLEVKKTIYDPCPPGFKVPNRNAFSGFSTTGANTSTSSRFSASNVSSYSTDKGYYFYINPSDHDAGTIFFPASGFRSGGSGSLYSVGSNGSYWSAAPYVNDSYQYGRYLNFKSGYVRPVYNDYRTYGFAVRPVAE